MTRCGSASHGMIQTPGCPNHDDANQSVEPQTSILPSLPEAPARRMTVRPSGDAASVSNASYLGFQSERE